MAKWKDTSNHWSKTKKREEVLTKVKKYLRSDNWKGKHRDKETLKKLNEGKEKWIRENQVAYWKSRKKVGKRWIKEGNPNWKGGISKSYKENNRINNRKWFEISRRLILQSGKCQKCNMKGNLVVHHIGDKYDHNEENLIVVCRGCHMKIHPPISYR